MSRKEVQNFVSSTRDDLEATLDEIEHRMTPAELTKQAAGWVSRSYDKAPGAWLVGIGVTAVAGVAAIIWALTKDD
jgi:hypothetical protein